VNTFDSNPENPQVDDGAIDLLVDGELSGPEYRKLLASLDHTPGAWRACAMAFLEAQAWKRDLGSVAEEAAEVRTAPPAVAASAPSPPRPPARSLWRRAGVVAAMAASFLATLTIGLAIRGTHRVPGLTPNPTEIAGSATSDPASSQLANIAPLPIGADPGNARRPDPSNPSHASTWQVVRVAPPGRSQDGPAVELPARPTSHFDPATIAASPPLPPEARNALRRGGYEVRERDHLVPVPSGDGGRLVFPVQEVELRYVGNGAYQ
jgi:hypothetical protein